MKKQKNWMKPFLEIPMNFNSGIQNQNARLLDFTCRFLENQGALIEETSGKINALLPKNLAGCLGTGEYITLVSHPDEKMAGEALNETDPGAGYYPIHFGSPLLDRILGITSDNPPLLNIKLNIPYLKSGGFENLISRQFEWHKATGSVTSFGQIYTRYLLLNCRYLAQSDEQKEGRFDLGSNLDTGAMIPGITTDIAGIDKEYKKNDSIQFSESVRARLHQLVRVYGQEAVDNEIIAFRNSMNRRYARDAKSLDDYYHALAEEMAASLERGNVSEALAADRKEKIAMIPEELSAKKADLVNKYWIKITISLAAAMVVSTPAVKILFTALVGRKQKNLSLIYNPITKQIDPMVCESCHRSIYRIAFCKDLHILCPQCHGNRGKDGQSV
jgi:hypothetical protein